MSDSLVRPGHPSTGHPATPLARGDPAGDDVPLREADPPLYRLTVRLIRRYPHLRPTAWRAAQLVRAGHVQAPLPGSDALAAVRSANNPAITYRVTWTARGLCCPCPSWERNAPLGPRGRPLCKHLLAYVLLLRLDRPLTPAPTADALWQRLRAILQQRLLPETWTLLWAEAVLVSGASSPTHLVLTVPDPAARWLAKARWRKPVEQLASEIAGRPVTVTIRQSPHDDL